MCSCSGNCNCNSTTIPRGPQGPPGPQGDQGIQGEQGLPGQDGTDGSNGINGKNAYTLTAEEFAQPAVNSTVTFEVDDVSWISLNQIVFVGRVNSTIDVGGYYLVTAKNPVTFPTITLRRLDWTIPGVSFVSTGNIVPGGSLVQASGTIGATGATGQNGNGITIIKSVTNTIPVFTSLNVPAGTSFTLTNTSDIFLANDLCPNDGDIGRITYEVVVRKTASVGPANISMDVYFGIQGFLPFPQLEPYTDILTNQNNNKLNQIQWNSNVNAEEYMYIKYVVDVQRITDSTANIFIDWKTKSATTSNSGCYHNVTTITALNFDDPAKYFEFAIKGFNNSPSATLTFNKSRFYVESLRLPQP